MDIQPLDRIHSLERWIDSLEFRIVAALGPYVTAYTKDGDAPDDLLIAAVKEFDRLLALETSLRQCREERDACIRQMYGR